MAILEMNYTAPVLRNKGVPVRMIVLNEDGSHKTKHCGDDDGNEWEEAETAPDWLRIDNNALADLEEIYGSLEKFETALNDNPTPTLRVVYGICFDGDPRSRVAFGRIPQGDIPQAAVAATTAFSLASGMDPQSAVSLHRKALLLAAEQQKTLFEGIDRQLEAMLTTETGTNSPTPSEPNSPPTPSSEPPGSSPEDSPTEG